MLLILGIGCKESGTIGLDVQPASDLVNGLFNDTTTLVAYTVKADSLRSDEPLLCLLGSYVDPVFGKSLASFYAKFSTPTSNIDFGVGYTPDSLVMTIAYAGYYGEAPTPQTVHIYQLAEGIDQSSAYYSNHEFAPCLIELAGGTISPNDTDLTISFKLNDPIFSSNDYAFADNAAFQNFLKGFYITTDTMVPGGLLYLDFNSASTKLTLYYNDSMSFDFTVTGESAWVNKFDHDYTGTAIEAQLADPSLGDSLVYVQPNAGVMVKLEMPYLKSWVSEESIAVNKAELVFSVFDDGSLATYGVPANLFISGAGDNTIITDQNEGATHFGGTYDAATKTYSFNIARYLHEVLNKGRSNDGIYLIIPNNLLTSGSVVSANRVILGGPGLDDDNPLRMKLNLIYTKL